MRLFTRLFVFVLVLGLATAAGRGETVSDRDLIEAVTAKLREQGGAEPDAVAVVSRLNGIAVKLYRDGRYAEAEQVARAALAEADRVLGAEHPKTLTSINNLAALHNSNGRYADAERLFRRARAVSERVLGSEHPDTLASINNLAGVCESLGHYDEAEDLYRRALATSDRVLGSDHPLTLALVNNLADIYVSTGRYGAADPLFRRALKEARRVLGDEHPDTLRIINNLAFVYHSQERYAEAEDLYASALAISERALEADHPVTLGIVNNLALMHLTQGHYDEAELLFTRVHASKERLLGAEHPETLTTLNNLAGLKLSQGRHRDAEPLLRSVLADNERLLGAEHPQTIKSARNLAFLYKSQGRNEEADPLFRRALAGSENHLGEAHPDTIETQLSLAVNLVKLDRIEPAVEQLRTLDGRQRTFVARQLDSTESERVRRQWLEKASRLQDVAFTLALAHPRGPALPLAADMLLRWKRLMSEEDKVLTRLVRKSPDPQVRVLASKVQEARARYSRLVSLSDPEPAQLAALKEAIADLDRLEVELRTRSRTFAESDALRAVTAEEVARVLSPNSALLDLRAFRLTDFTTGERRADHWLALLILAKDPASGDSGAAIGKPASVQHNPPPTLRLLDLGPIAASDADRQQMSRLTDEDVCLTRYLVLQERPGEPNRRPDCAGAYDAAHFATPAAAQSRQTAITAELDAASARFYAALFGPLDPELAGFETLYIAPDGVLDLVPFARLRLPDGRYWIERQALRQVQSGRDLIAREPVPAARGLLALGAVDYGSPPSAVRSSKRAKPHSLRGDQASAPPAADTGPDQPSPRLRTACSRFSSLDGTKAELDYLDTHFRPDGGKVLILRGRDATKSRLKSYAPPPRILHLATHGCFIARADPTERPMTLSLLALAGANRAAARPGGAAGGDDGILHALEVLDLDLTGTELVALSACDTGKGEVDRSEGVYGMVRAFQIAGAANVLMTLRVLDDELGTEFIADFYRNWLAARPDTPADPAFALRQTQKEWIASERPEKRDPRHWAPYVLVERR